MDASSRRKFFQQQCQPVFNEYQLMREFVLFQQQTITNVYVVPSHSSAFKWFGVIFIHSGLYQGAILRFSLYIPEDYPSNQLPKVIFDPVPFHPLINPRTGELNISRDFESWTSSNQLWQVIWMAKNVFLRVEKDIEDCQLSSPNQSYELSDMFHNETVRMYREDNEKFKLKVAETVAQCHAKLYDPPVDSQDRNAIIFGPWNPELHDDLRHTLVTGKAPLSFEDNGSTSAKQGLSWVQKGTQQMFSKPAV
ncbi:AKT-interacting protein [Halotydeus destructor]|nr:AKT-interacting protein [Halotydeus destructor]